MDAIPEGPFSYKTACPADHLLENWQAFIIARELRPAVVQYVASSWQRCLPFINPTDLVLPNRLNADHLHAARAASTELVSLALPVMEDIYQYVESSHSILLLTNSACCVLEVLGDPEMVAIAERAGIAAGALISEQQFGTNSIALAVSERMPTQVRGPEHFLRQLHGVAAAAAPIFFVTGRLLGTIALLTTCEHYTEHSLGLVVAAASAIASQRQSETLLGDYNNQLAQLNAILSSVTEGVLVWDAEGTLLHVNTAAEKMLNLPAQALLGRNFRRYISLPLFLDDAINRQEALENVSGRVHLADRLVHFIVNLKFVEIGRGLYSTVFTFRSESEGPHLLEKSQSNVIIRTLDSLEGDSAGTRRVRQLARLAASARASVLIRGEHGTGKTLLASAIHNTSPRREEPFVICACASIPRDLMMVELVGLEKGVSSKEPWGQPGKFELAHSGSLYLQDMEALTLEAQTALLNLLELGIVQRLGKGRPVPVDVRIIASTSANLEQLIERGSFRGDLYYRLSPFEIRVPPLRERAADIPTLVDSVLERLSVQFNRPTGISAEAMQLLRNYQWPGNISELETLLARAASQLQGKDVIAPEDLPDFVRQPHQLRLEMLSNVLVNSLDEMEREALLQAARMCHGHLGEMSKALGISRTTLWRKLKAANISVNDFRHAGALPDLLDVSK